jgi:hypothetical protein
MENVNPIAFKVLEKLLVAFEKVYLPIYKSLKPILLGRGNWAGETTALLLLAIAYTVGYALGKDIRSRRAGSIVAVILWLWVGIILISALGL